MHRFESETIHISDLRVHCIVGVHPREREQLQPLVLSISFPGNFGTAEREEQLAATVDYAKVAQAAREFVVQGRYKLLETLARGLAAHLGERFGLSRVSLHVRKPEAIADSGGAAVSLTWVSEEEKGQ